MTLYGSNMDRVFYVYDITLSHDMHWFVFLFIHRGQKMKSIDYNMPMNTIYFFLLLI